MSLEDNIEELKKDRTKKAFLTNRKITVLPSNISKLTDLQELHLYNNTLRKLPNSIKSLKNLKVLDVSRNRLHSVGLGIAMLENLHSLILNNNQLTAVPANIGNLKKLQVLNLSNNEIKTVPANLSQLKKLGRLDLSSNQLTHVPKKIFDLDLDIVMDARSFDFGINLGNNPLESPPLEIAMQGIEAVRDYFKQLEGETAHLFEAKLLVVGQGGVGKTFLLNRLIYDGTPKTVSTEGIDIHKWNVKPKKSKKIQVNFWDFGGQAIYHSTHQFFLTKRSLYLFVWEARSDDDISSFDYWLNTIKVLSGDSPVLVIQSKIETRTKLIDQALWSKLFVNILEYHNVSAVEGTGIKGLSDSIAQEIKCLPHIGDKLPKTWTDIREDLDAMKENFISYATYHSICKQYKLNDKQVDRLSKYYHDLGVFLHFADSPVLRDMVFLKPDWATNSVYKILDNKRVQANFGRFSFNDLGKIWTDQKSYPKKIHGDLIELMKNFELCFELPQNNEYIIPGFLNPNKPDFLWNFKSNLRFKYEYEFMPSGIMTRFIVNTHDLIVDGLYWKSGLVLAFDDTRALVMKTKNRVIDIWINNGDKRGLLSILRRELDRINRSFSNLEVNQLLQCICSECRNNEKAYFFSYKKLLRFKIKDKITIPCGESCKDVNIELLLGGVETATESDNKAIQIVHNIHGDYITIHGTAEFTKVEVHQNILNVKRVIEQAKRINKSTKKKFLEHADHILKEFTKEGVKEGCKALKEYMKNEGIPKALCTAVKVASGGLFA